MPGRLFQWWPDEKALGFNQKYLNGLEWHEGE